MGLLHLVVERHRRLAHVVENRLQLRMEQRQPVFHARMLAIAADGFIERIIVQHRAERRHIACAEPLHGLLVDRHFIDGRQIEPVDLGHRHLRIGIEAPDRLDRVTKIVEPDRLLMSRREDVDDATAHRKVTRLHHRTRPRESIAREERQQLVDLQRQPFAQDQVCIGHALARRHALQRSAHRRHNNGRALATRGHHRQRRQGRHALGHHLRLR